MNTPNTEIALQLFKEGAVLIDTTRGFEMSYHDLNPDAPRSPIKFNLRPPGTKDGMVSKELFNKIGLEMASIAATHKSPPSVLVGVPNAGDVLVDNIRLHGNIFKSRQKPACIRLAKLEGAGVRRIVGIREFEGTFLGREKNTTWLIDDVITTAGSKIQSLDIVCAASFKVPVCLVVIDREQGGTEELGKYNTSLVSLFTMSWLVQFYRQKGLIHSDQHDAILRYMKNVNEHASPLHA